MARMTVYTDGSCLWPNGPGGWAAIVIHPEWGRVLDLSGGEGQTTNNRMELAAAVYGLRSLSPAYPVTVVSDSAYLVNAWNEGWLKRWIRRGWATREGGPVKNRDLWEALVRVAQDHAGLEWVHIRGHRGQPENEACDRLARVEAERRAGPTMSPGPGRSKRYLRRG